MSTRSMTCVRENYSGDSKLISLYRHCDGYPALAGAAIVEAIWCATCPEDVLSRLLAMRYDVSQFRETPEPIYRAATWQPEDQGDLEHVYIVEAARTLADGGVRPSVLEWTVTHYQRPDRSWSDADSDYRRWPHQKHDRASLIALVNQDRKAINARIKAMHGAQTEGHALLEVEATR